LEWHFAVIVLDHWRSCICTDIEGFIKLEAATNSPLDMRLRYLFAIYRQCASAALADAPTVIFKVKPDDVFSGRQSFIGGDIPRIARIL